MKLSLMYYNSFIRMQRYVKRKLMLRVHVVETLVAYQKIEQIGCRLAAVMNTRHYHFILHKNAEIKKWRDVCNKAVINC